MWKRSSHRPMRCCLLFVLALAGVAAAGTESVTTYTAEAKQKELKQLRGGLEDMVRRWADVEPRAVCQYKQKEREVRAAQHAVLQMVLTGKKKIGTGSSVRQLCVYSAVATEI